jgi:hypothetical protein
MHAKAYCTAIEMQQAAVQHQEDLMRVVDNITISSIKMEGRLGGLERGLFVDSSTPFY